MDEVDNYERINNRDFKDRIYGENEEVGNDGSNGKGLYKKRKLKGSIGILSYIEK